MCIRDRLSTIALACRAGVDQIIAADLGVYVLLRRCAPGLRISGSTQMSIHNKSGVRMLRRLGYDRVVLARELSQKEIAAITREGGGHPVECIDNDETAAVIALTVKARTLVILSGVEGIYADPADPGTLVREVTAKDSQELLRRISELQRSCVGASRAGANGAGAKLEFIKEPAVAGTTVIIGHARHRLSDLLAGRVPCTRIGLV